MAYLNNWISLRDMKIRVLFYVEEKNEYFRYEGTYYW